MSVDCWSVCFALPPSKAKQILRDLSPTQRCGAILGPDEEVIIDAWVGTRDIDVAAIGDQYGDEWPPVEFWEGACVSLSADSLDLFDSKGIVITDTMSALAGLDRVLALPNGFDLLRGHAVGHLPSSRIDGVRLGLSRLWERLGGKADAIESLQGYLCRDSESNDHAAAEVIALLEDALATAKAKKLDVILVSAVPP
jgi:hypothetical protein